MHLVLKELKEIKELEELKELKELEANTFSGCIHKQDYWHLSPCPKDERSDIYL